MKKIEVIRAVYRNRGPRVIASRTDDRREPDITLINLNLYITNVNGRLDRQTYVPLGILYLASTVEREGYNVELIDYQLFTHAEDFDAEQFVAAIGPTARWVGISCMSNLTPFAILCAKLLKDTRPDIRIVLGGVGPSPVAKEIVGAFPFIDSVVEGEGEANIVQLLKGHDEPLPGRRIVGDLDVLPLPAYSLIDFDLYDASPNIITSRGCPYKCAFCTEPHNFGAGVRFRAIESVIDELELVHARSGRELFLFQDDTLPLHRSRFRGLLKAFRQNLSFPIKWKCFSRVDLMDRELMDEMSESGCVQVKYGIEAGSNRLLERIAKGFSIEKAYEVVSESVNFFPSVHASFIWGYPFESLDDFEDTLDAAVRFENAGASVLLFQFSPLAGSAIYREYRDRLNLTFSDQIYSTYVYTGHERGRADQFEVSSKHNPVFEMVRRHPDIFPGFFQYEEAAIDEKRRRLKPFAWTVRTKNEYDL